MLKEFQEFQKLPSSAEFPVASMKAHICIMYN